MEQRWEQSIWGERGKVIGKLWVENDDTKELNEEGWQRKRNDDWRT